MFNVTALTAQGTDSKSGAAVVEYLMLTEYYLEKDGDAQDTMAWGGKMVIYTPPRQAEEVLANARGQ